MVLKDARFSKPSPKTGETRFLYVAGVGHDMGTSRDALIEFFKQFGELEDETQDGAPIEMLDNRRYCFVCYKSAEGAKNALRHLSQNLISSSEINKCLGVSKLCVKFAEEKRNVKHPPLLECTSASDNIEVPGCCVFSDFLSEEDEDLLMREFAGDDAPWKNTLTRRVQHYGFPFNYRTLMLDYSRPTDPLPASCVALSERVQHFYHQINRHGEISGTDRTAASTCAPGSTGSTGLDSAESCCTNATMPMIHEDPINQLTINEYFPGQGIASHTDTETCLGPVIYVLNLGSGIVMTLTKNVTGGQQDAEKAAEGGKTADPYAPVSAATGVFLDSSTSSSEPLHEVPTGSKAPPLRKLLYLPRRSLLVLSGEARYQWSHGIMPRKQDRVNGEMISRERRISFTFRHALKPGSIPQSELQSSELELDHVVRVYDNIAVHWNHTRGKRKVYWHRVKDFLDGLPPGSLLADIGSGDGKYFGVNPGVISIGCDRSLKLLEVSRDTQHDTFCCDAVKLPLTTGMFDATLCIAVLHHLSSVARRYAVISELVRITRPGGVIMLQAWALEQGADSKRVFASQDTMVPWRLNKRFLQQQQQQQLKEQERQPKEQPPRQEEQQRGLRDGDACIQAPLQSHDQLSPHPGVDSAEHLSGSSSTTGQRIADEGNKEVTTKENSCAGTATAVTAFMGPEGQCKHVQEEQGDLVFQRYCHVYKEGELEELCSSVPSCVVEEAGWDKGNWFVCIRKVHDERLDHVSDGPESNIPVLPPRKF